MATEFDLVVRNGTVVDGTGAAPREADVGVRDGRIAAVGTIAGKGREEINATGRIVTPGFVDIHTHYDGQAVWDTHMTPSAWHGVTTAVMGLLTLLTCTPLFPVAWAGAGFGIWALVVLNRPEVIEAFERRKKKD